MNGLNRRSVAFHAQQAAEKAVKALLVTYQIDFPRTHNVELLLNLCQTAGFEGIEITSDAATLTHYAVITRYPSQEEPVSRQEAREAAEVATRIVVWVAQQLSNQK